MLSRTLRASALCALALTTFAGCADAAGFKVLHTFTDGSDGAAPYDEGVIADSAGNLYGATQWGGGCTYEPMPLECGVVYKIAKDGTETILHAFCTGQTCSDGMSPSSGLIEDKAGNLYGATSFGGADNGGTIYKLAPDGTETVLYSFTTAAEGYLPGGNLVRDKAGDIYGTTSGGGANSAGTIFEFTKSGSLSVLYSFKGGSEGNGPQGISADSAGNLYVLMQYGGNVVDCPGAQYVQPGCGTVVKLSTSGTATVLHTFAGGSDGDTPYGQLIADSDGNLYGATQSGGSGNCSDYGPGCGVVFKIDASGNESVLYAFQGGQDGKYPRAGLIMDLSGNLYGTTYAGGLSKLGCELSLGCGTVFKLTPGGKKSTLYAFATPASNPWAPVLLHKGKFYGTTLFGQGTGCTGTGCGTVFSLK